MDQDKLIDAANAQAAMYDGDDRQDIKTDVMNAFFAGAKFGATVEREACAKACEAAVDAVDPTWRENRPDEAAGADAENAVCKNLANAIRMRSNF